MKNKPNYDIGEVTSINGSNVEVYIEEKRAFIVYTYSPKHSYARRDIKVGQKVGIFFNNERDRIIYRVDILSK